MGLETATYVSQLTPTNPIATDRKNQGDDHLRLLKAVLQNSLPNLDRAYRVPEVVAKSAPYTVLESDENKIIFCDVSAGSVTLTLSVPSFDGWSVSIVKGSASANPVFVNNSVLTQVGAVAKLRVDVPWTETRLCWTGGNFVKMASLGEAFPGTLMPWPAAAAPIGHAIPQGQSLLRADYPELFAAWGTTWGAVDGTRFNVPNTVDRFLVGAGPFHPLAATGGVYSHTIVQGNLPNPTLTTTIGAGQGSHDHPSDNPAGLFVINEAGGPLGVFSGAGNLNGHATTGAATLPAMTGTTPLGGSSIPFETRPPYLGMNYIFRLC